MTLCVTCLSTAKVQRDKKTYPVKTNKIYSSKRPITSTFTIAARKGIKAGLSCRSLPQNGGRERKDLTGSKRVIKCAVEEMIPVGEFQDKYGSFKDQEEWEQHSDDVSEMKFFHVNAHSFLL